MHRSRVYAVLIDTPEADAERTTSFWSAALGVTARPMMWTQRSRGWSVSARRR
jgi:hypothetical protein